MAYVKQTWVDETRTKSIKLGNADGDGYQELQAVEYGTTGTAGTPVSAAKLNHIEDGIEMVSTEAKFVSGIMTANGTVTLGFQPSAVIVTGTFFSNITVQLAFALPSYPHYRATSPTASLTVTSTGFTTNGMYGYNGEPTSQFPLHYIAFK